jgi:alpha/beta hydrolase fold
MLTAINQLEPAPADVSITDYHLRTDDGATLLLRWYTKNGPQPGSAVLYLHGGGMIVGSVAAWDGPVSRIVSRSGVPFLSVDYRLAPYAAWSYDDNITAWQANLGDQVGADTVPVESAPARLIDATELPPAYIEAGQLDIFRDEDLRYGVTLSHGAV